ncbi:MAG: general stress protein [Marmoricola sp.]
MSNLSNPASTARLRSALTLQFPMSLGVYDQYADAQKAVDHLSDNEFPVQNCLIVGTELKQIERVTGRLTNGRVAVGGLMSGAWMGLFVGVVLSLFGDNNAWATIGSTVLFGAFFGLVWAMAGYRATGGMRDFTSISLVVATRYVVLVEHKFAEQARGLLATMPGAATPFD